METSPIKMTAETTNHMLGPLTPKFLAESISEPDRVMRTPAEKARILASLTLQLAALDSEEGCHDGDA